MKDSEVVPAAHQIRGDEGPDESRSPDQENAHYFAIGARTATISYDPSRVPAASGMSR